MTPDKGLEEALEGISDFVSLFLEEFHRRGRERLCEQYMTGLLLPGERKSIEPLSGRVPGSDVQSLQQFVNQSPWDHQDVLKKLSVVMRQKLRRPKGVIVLDDTPLRKKGRHSVGVAPQYCGTIGAIANCQSVVTLHAIAGKVHFPYAAQLYLPREWTQDRERLQRAGVPEEFHGFEERWRIALRLLKEYPAPCTIECLTFDAGYGEVRPFLTELDTLNIPFVGQIPQHHCYWPLNTKLNTTTKLLGRPRQFPAIASRKTKAISARRWEALLEGTYKTFRLPSGQTVSCACSRVFEAVNKAYYRPGPHRWLLVAKCGDGKTRYFVSNMPESVPLKSLVEFAFCRWKIEQGYQQLKEELGLDHFEGRSWQGLHHHITICFMTYAFLVLWRRSKKNPPSRYQLPVHSSYNPWQSSAAHTAPNDSRRNFGKRN